MCRSYGFALGEKQRLKITSPTLQKPPSAVEHIFNDEFNGEERHQRSAAFEKIIGENAMFAQQDLP